MSERVIAKAWYGEFDSVMQTCPDPDAPSVSEVVEELRAARRVLEGDSYWLPDGTHRLDNLIARLEGA